MHVHHTGKGMNDIVATWAWYCLSGTAAVAGYMMTVPTVSPFFAFGSLGCDVQLSKKWQLFRPRMEGLAAGLRTVAKNAAGANFAGSQGAAPDPVAALKQLLTAVSEPAGEALAALSHFDTQARYGQARTTGYERPLSMHGAGFGMEGENAVAGNARAGGTEQHHAAAKIAADTEELLAQLAAAQQAAEAVTASLQDTASRARHNAAAPGAHQRPVRPGRQVQPDLALSCCRGYIYGGMHRDQRASAMSTW